MDLDRKVTLRISESDYRVIERKAADANMGVSLRTERQSEGGHGHCQKGK